MNAWPYDLPERETISGYDFGISYSIVFNDKKQTFSKTLAEAGIVENEIITLWLTISYSENNNKRSGDFIEFLTDKSLSKDTLQNAINEYEKKIKDTFDDNDNELIDE